MCFPSRSYHSSLDFFHRPGRKLLISEIGIDLSQDADLLAVIDTQQIPLPAVDQPERIRPRLDLFPSVSMSVRVGIST